MQNRILALCAASICLFTAPAFTFAADDAAPAPVDAAAAAAAPQAPYDPAVDGFGFMDYKLGEAVDTKALEAAGFELDPYYDPDIYYSKEDTMPFPTGPEGYRFDIGIVDGKISNIVVEFNMLIPSADGSTLDARPHFKDIAVDIAQQLDAKYGAWDHETWEYDSDTFSMSVFDFLSPDYALSMRISTLSIAMLYTTADDRETQADFEAAIAAQGEAPAEAPASPGTST